MVELAACLFVIWFCCKFVIPFIWGFCSAFRGSSRLDASIDALVKPLENLPEAEQRAFLKKMWNESDSSIQLSYLATLSPADKEELLSIIRD